MRQFAALIALLLLSSLGEAADIYVDNVRGSDSYSGLSDEPSSGVEGPVETIAKALRIAGRADRITIANTGIPYRESLTLQGRHNGGFPGYPLEIIGNNAILDGRGTVPIDSWQHVVGDVHCFSPVYKAHHQLYLDDKPLKRLKIDSMDELDKLTPMTWTLLDGNILFCSEPDRGPGSYRLSFTARRAGLTLYEVRHVKIIGLTVQGFQLDGINVHSNCYHVELIDITSRGNGRSGISVGGASRVEVKKSLLGDNGEAQLRGESFSTTVVSESSLLENTAPPFFLKDAKMTIDGKPVEPPNKT